MSEKEAKETKVDDLSSSDVQGKYKKAAEIANGAIKLVMDATKPGAKIVELCEMGDKYILDETAKIYNVKKGGAKVEKGIGFPTCVSVNNIVGHCSPVSGDAAEIKEGDVVKIDLGVALDGYVAVAAHTVVVNNGAVITGRVADAMQAALVAADCALKMLKPGNKNSQVTDIIGKVAEDFKVTPVAGVLSHNMTRFVIDGPKVIINKPDVDQKVEEVTFEPNQVWAIDMVFSTGDGKPRASEERTTILKRALQTTYSLKIAASRTVLSEINKRFPTFPFAVRSLETKNARFGLKECLDHELLAPYPMLMEKDGETVVHFKFTALITPSGTVKISGLNVDPKLVVQSEHKVTNQEVLDVLKTSSKKQDKKKKKKTDKKDAAPAEATQE